MQKDPGFTNIDTDLHEYARLRVTSIVTGARRWRPMWTMVGRTLETMLGGRLVTHFKQDGEQFDVIVQVARDGRDTPERISTLTFAIALATWCRYQSGDRA